MSEPRLYKLLMCKMDPTRSHVLRNAKVLPCGNTACLECIEQAIDRNSSLKCPFEKCKLKHDINMEKLLDNVMIQEAISDNIRSIGVHIYQELQQKYNSLKQSLDEKDDCLNNVFEYIDTEICLRIESIKNEFDNLQVKLLETSKSMKEEFKTFLSKCFKEHDDYYRSTIDGFKKEYRKNDTTNTSALKAAMYTCDECIRELNSFDNNFKQILRKITFNSSDWKPDESIIGDIRTSVYINLQKKKRTKPKCFNLEDTVQSLNRMCNLNDKNLLVTGSDDNKLLLLDENFKKIRDITAIDDVNFTTPLSVCTDYKENVYICDFGNQRIIIADMELSEIKKIIGKHGRELGDFLEPLDMCFCVYLYVLDKELRRVQMFHRDGEFHKEIKLYYDTNDSNNEINKQSQKSLLSNPNRIGANHSVIAVLDCFRKVFLYDMNGDVKQIIKSNNSTLMCLVDDYLFTCNKDGCLLCYEQANSQENNSCDIKFVCKFERNLEILKNSKSYITFFNQNLLVALADTKTLVVV